MSEPEIAAVKIGRADVRSMTRAEYEALRERAEENAVSVSPQLAPEKAKRP